MKTDSNELPKTHRSFFELQIKSCYQNTYSSLFQFKLGAEFSVTANTSRSKNQDRTCACRRKVLLRKLSWRGIKLERYSLGRFILG